MPRSLSANLPNYSGLLAARSGLVTCTGEAQFDLLRRLQDFGLLPREIVRRSKSEFTGHLINQWISRAIPLIYLRIFAKQMQGAPRGVPYRNRRAIAATFVESITLTRIPVPVTVRVYRRRRIAEEVLRSYLSTRHLLGDWTSAPRFTRHKTQRQTPP